PTATPRDRPGAGLAAAGSSRSRLRTSTSERSRAAPAPPARATARPARAITTGAGPARSATATTERSGVGAERRVYRTCVRGRGSIGTGPATWWGEEADRDPGEGGCGPTVERGPSASAR